MRLWNILSFVILGILSLVQGEDTRGTADKAATDFYYHIFEAEEFGNLPFYGNWYSKPDLGWYIKEHRHASGRAFVVCDELNINSVMTKRMESPLAPGDLKLFVRVALMRLGPGNQLQASVGRLEAGQFVEEQSAYFQWQLGSGYGWLGQNLSIARPCSHIQVRATRIGCRGIGDVPEVPQAQVILDSFVITNNPGARLVPDRTGRGRTTLELPDDASRAKKAIPLREEGATVFMKNSAERLRKFGRKTRALKPIKRPQPLLLVPRRNYLPDAFNVVPNGSFELSLHPWWFTQVNYFHGYNITSENQDQDFAAHGTYSLKLPLTPINFLEEKPSRYEANLVSRAFPVRPLTDYWLSVTARANRPNLKLNTRGEKFDLSLDWKKFSVRLSTGSKQISHSLSFSVQSPEPGRIVWLDEIQMSEIGSTLEKKTSAPAKFDVRGRFEVGLRTDSLGEIYYDDKPVWFSIISVNTRLATQKDVLEIRVLDTRGSTIGQKSIPISIAPYDLKESRIALLREGKRGAFLAVYWLRNLPQPPAAIAFCVVGNPAKAAGKRPFIGTYSQSVEEAMKLYARIGFDWNAPLNDRIFRPDVISKGPKQYQWYDRYVKQWERYGLQFVGETIPSEIPDWDRGILGTEAAAGASRPFFQLENWRRHLDNMVGHYKDIQYWILTDEAELYRTASDFAPYAKIAYDQAKQSNPKSQGMFSASANIMEKVYELVGTEKIQDVFGGSRFMAGKWIYTRDREFQRKYRLPVWYIGVGYPSFWIYDILDEGAWVRSEKARDLNRRLNRQAFDLMMQTAIVAPDRFCHYTGKLDGGRDPYTFFNRDNTFKPHAVQFVNTLNHMRLATKGDLLRLQNVSFIESYYFQRENRTYAVLNGAGVRGDYRMRLKSDLASVTVLDRNFNPVEVEDGKGTIEFDLPADDLRILQETTGHRVQFLDAVRGVVAQSYFSTRYVMLPLDSSSNVFALSVMGRPLGTTTDRGRLTVLGESRDIKLTDSPQLYFFRIPRTFGNQPVTNMPVNYELLMADGKDYSDQHAMWVMTAPPADKPLIIDGDLTEWTRQIPIFLYASQSLDGSYQTLQARVAGHTIRNLSDSSARIWARWNSEALYFAVDILDDKLTFAPDSPDRGKPGDQFIIHLDMDLFGDLHSNQRNEDDYSLLIGPGFERNPTLLLISHDDVKTVIDAAFHRSRDGYSVEFSLPWSKLGGYGANVVFGESGVPVMGFDAVLRDADDSTLLKSELSWAGYDGVDGDPTTFGQLILLPSDETSIERVVLEEVKKSRKKWFSRKNKPAVVDDGEPKVHSEHVDKKPFIQRLKIWRRDKAEPVVEPPAEPVNTATGSGTEKANPETPKRNYAGLKIKAVNSEESAAPVEPEKVKPEEEKRGFFKRLFRRNKKK